MLCSLFKTKKQGNSKADNKIFEEILTYSTGSIEEQNHDIRNSAEIKHGKLFNNGLINRTQHPDKKNIEHTDNNNIFSTFEDISTFIFNARDYINSNPKDESKYKELYANEGEINEEKTDEFPVFKNFWKTTNKQDRKKFKQACYSLPRIINELMEKINTEQENTKFKRIFGTLISIIINIKNQKVPFKISDKIIKNIINYDNEIMFKILLEEIKKKNETLCAENKKELLEISTLDTTLDLILKNIQHSPIGSIKKKNIIYLLDSKLTSLNKTCVLGSKLIPLDKIRQKIIIKGLRTCAKTDPEFLSNCFDAFTIRYPTNVARSNQSDNVPPKDHYIYHKIKAANELANQSSQSFKKYISINSIKKMYPTDNKVKRKFFSKNNAHDIRDYTKQILINKLKKKFAKTKKEEKLLLRKFLYHVKGLKNKEQLIYLKAANELRIQNNKSEEILSGHENSDTLSETAKLKKETDTTITEGQKKSSAKKRESNTHNLPTHTSSSVFCEISSFILFGAVTLPISMLLSASIICYYTPAKIAQKACRCSKHKFKPLTFQQVFGTTFFKKTTRHNAKSHFDELKKMSQNKTLPKNSEQNKNIDSREDIITETPGK